MFFPFKILQNDIFLKDLPFQNIFPPKLRLLRQPIKWRENDVRQTVGTKRRPARLPLFCFGWIGFGANRLRFDNDIFCLYFESRKWLLKAVYIGFPLNIVTTNILYRILYTLSTETFLQRTTKPCVNLKSSPGLDVLQWDWWV